MLKKSYKRFFAFGCSYTSYVWAMWPEVIKHELGDVEFYNLGKAGAGNSYIAHQIYLADIKYNFGPDDLIMVCWTHAYRMDWLLSDKDDWRLEGFMFYENEIHKHISDEAKSLENCEFRDSNIIACATEYLNNLSSHAITFSWIDNLSTEQASLQPFSEHMTDIPIWDTEYYQKKRLQLWEDYIGFDSITKWDDDYDAEFYVDGHPMPIEALEFLSEALEYEFDKETVNAVFNYHEKMSEAIKSNFKYKNMIWYAWEIASDMGPEARNLVYFLD